MQGEKDDNITNKGMLHRDDECVLQFYRQFSGFRVESKNTTSFTFTFFIGLDGERLIALLLPKLDDPNRYSVVASNYTVHLLRSFATLGSM